ncbi:BgTH12-02971 [Blumeria graminis f. sp. triticale]|uniref:BgtA-20987 n=3 Tax=Blumeria graminis TaxID=34373 RepID=A0A9X9QDI4_BLUGR|nr:hypothetical protein BGT96224_A20987 [Blumeria graminis f. sp. tritici 96224]CAD6503304.1 BgTH12-02971 [Blumeria graminis f. sp. triticale]VDB89304.1 BgtA-20987 [Blumeria graminis f. sp. tritici]
MTATSIYDMQHLENGQEHKPSPGLDIEREYDRLRDLARQEQEKRATLSSKSQQAYKQGDGAVAHKLSEEAKTHAEKANQYNKQASEFIFRENNVPGRVAEDTIDLHGQFEKEVEIILKERISHAQKIGQPHLHVIVGKGNHSTNHVQKIKPKVEQVCRQLGLQYTEEVNAGRIFINLKGEGAAIPPTAHDGNVGHDQQGDQNNELEKLARKFVPKVLKKLDGCCSIM